MKSTRKTNRVLFTVLLLVLILLVSTSCNAEQTPTTPSSHYQPNTILPDEFCGILREKKLYITSIGQAPDMHTIALTLNSLEIDYTLDSTLDASTVEDGSIVFLVVGCSYKGLEGKNTTVQNEQKRVEKFAQTCGQKNVTIIGWHIGGVSRRGTTSDLLIQDVIKTSSLFLFTEEGNMLEGEGAYNLSDWCLNSDVPYCQIDENWINIISQLEGNLQ